SAGGLEKREIRHERDERGGRGVPRRRRVEGLELDRRRDVARARARMREEPRAAAMAGRTGDQVFEGGFPLPSTPDPVAAAAFSAHVRCRLSVLILLILLKSTRVRPVRREILKDF